jgi:ABC-type uncharacterized transport system permease subunit
MLLRLYTFVMTILFGLFTYFQFNDPDSMVWVGIYGAPCLLFLLAFFHIASSKTALLGSIGYGIGFILMAASVGEWAMENELARESGGVAMVSLAFLGFWLVLPKFKTWIKSSELSS